MSHQPERHSSFKHAERAGRRRPVVVVLLLLLEVDVATKAADWS
jgi:hypothetical protein